MNSHTQMFNAKHASEVLPSPMELAVGRKKKMAKCLVKGKMAKSLQLLLSVL